MNITKVELLWSRDCPLACSGCAMPTDGDRPYEVERHEAAGTPAEWDAGMRRVRALGSRFVAIYGAEPLTRPEGLPDLLRSIRAAGMAYTLITALPTSRRLEELIRAFPDFDSLTVSYDALDLDAAPDRWRKRKTAQGWLALEHLARLRDRSVVAMVTRGNVADIPAMAARATDAGCWFLFDLYHPRHGALSKCGNPGTVEIPTAPEVQRMAAELLSMKRAGAKIHASEQYLIALQNYPGNPRYFWHCAGPVTGWLTLDCDGTILACDDWQDRFPRGRIWSGNWSVRELEDWLQVSRNACTGCAWNTHYDAVAIEAGQPLGSYVHG